MRDSNMACFKIKTKTCDGASLCTFADDLTLFLIRSGVASSRPLEPIIPLATLIILWIYDDISKLDLALPVLSGEALCFINNRAHAPYYRSSMGVAVAEWLLANKLRIVLCTNPIFK